MPVKTDDLPTSLRIGPHDISICHLSESAQKDDYGVFCLEEQHIGLLPEYKTGTVAAETLLHEIFHAVFHIGSLEPGYSEEHIVSVLATYTTQVLRDNPALLPWLMKAVTQSPPGTPSP